MIREATETDIPALVEMARSMHKESPRYRGIEFVEEDCRKFLKAALDKKDTQIIFVSDTDGIIYGMLGCILSVYISFNHNVMCSYDTGFYVVPEKRKTPIAYRLVKAYENWASQKNVATENMGISVSTGVKSDEVYGFLEKMGYTEQGRSFGRTVQKEN